MNIKRTDKKAKLGAAGVIVAVLVITAGIILFSNYSWGRYLAENDRLYNAAQREAIEKLASSTSIEDINRISKDSKLSADSLCQASWMQTARIKLVDDSKNYQDECDVRRRKVEQVSKHAGMLYDYLRSESAVATILKAAHTKLSDVKEGDFANRKKVWQQTLDDMQRAEISDEYAGIVKLQQSSISEVVKAYSTIMDANKSQQRTKFDNAAVELRDAYGKLAEDSNASQAEYRKLESRMKESLLAL